MASSHERNDKMGTTGLIFPGSVSYTKGSVIECVYGNNRLTHLSGSVEDFCTIFQPKSKPSLSTMTASSDAGKASSRRRLYFRTGMLHP